MAYYLLLPIISTILHELTGREVFLRAAMWLLIGGVALVMGMPIGLMLLHR